MPRRDSTGSHGLRRAIWSRFADGAEHNIDEVAAACGHLIPPEIAVRCFATKYRPHGRPISEQVEIGRRRLIAAVLRELGAEALGPGRRRRWDRLRLPVGSYGYIRGEGHPSARLTAEQVVEIRRRYAAGGVIMARLALEYGVGKSSIQQLVRRETWKDVA